MDAATGSFLVAGFALAWTIYRDFITREDIKKETAERKDQLAREEGRQEEELRLLRLQFERQSETDQTKKAAELVGKSTGWMGDSTGVTYPMSVRNVGNAVARDVKVWLAVASPDPSDPVDGLARVTADYEIGALVQNDPAEKFNLLQANASAGGGVPRDGVIVARWSDETGERTEAIGKLTVFL